MDAAAWKAKGNEEFSRKNYKGAIEAFGKAIEVDPANHVLYSNLSAAHAAMNEWGPALEHGNKCVSLKPDWGKGYARVAAAYHGMRRYDDAIEQYNKGLSIEPESSLLKGGLQSVEAEKRQAQTQSDPFAKVFGPDTLQKIQANPRLSAFLKQPDYVKIINTIVANPTMVQMFIKDQRVMATFLELSGVNIEEARARREGGGEKTRDEEEDEPKPAPPKPQPKKQAPPAATLATQIKEEGNKLYKQKDFEGALAKYREALQTEPTNTTFLLNCTAVFFEQGEFEKCLGECDAALQHASDNKAAFQTVVKLMTRKASCLQKLNRHQEAIELFKKALLEWRNPDTLAKLEACEREKKKMDEEAYIDVDLSLKHKEEGNTFFRADQYPEAVKEYSEGIRRNPKDHTIYSNRAAAYLKLGAYDDAIKDCDACLEIKPTFTKALARKGHAYFWRKEYNRALNCYDDGLKVDAQNAECLDGKQRTLYKIQEMATSSEGDQEAAQRAMADPEIREIMSDSYMQLVLSEMQKDPTRIRDYSRDPNISAKLNKLIAAGIIRFGGPGDAPPDPRSRGRGGR